LQSDEGCVDPGQGNTTLAMFLITLKRQIFLDAKKADNRIRWEQGLKQAPAGVVRYAWQGLSPKEETAMSNFCLKPQLISIIMIPKYQDRGHCQRSHDRHDIIRVFCDSSHKVTVIQLSNEALGFRVSERFHFAAKLL
jgi:hypothetical protein